MVLRATIVFQNDEHNRYWQVKSLCDTPLWYTAPYLSLIHTLTSDIFIKMCISVDYSIRAWDNHINGSKLPSAAKNVPLWKNEEHLFRYRVYTLIKHLLDRNLRPCAKASVILKSQSTRHARLALGLCFCFCFFFVCVKISVLLGQYFVSDGHKLYSLSVCTQKATSQQNTLLHWPTNVPFPGYDVISKQMI